MNTVDDFECDDGVGEGGGGGRGHGHALTQAEALGKRGLGNI
jgi:hypothetical protein